MSTVSLKSVRLGEGRTKVLIPITASNHCELESQIKALEGSGLDILEWRIDFLDDATDVEAVLAAADVVANATEKFLQEAPILGTFRTAEEGGEKAISTHDYQDLLVALARSGKVAAIDVELFRGEFTSNLISQVHQAGTKVIASFHNFEKTPPVEEIVERLKAMDQAGADVPKLACMPHNPGDLLTLLRGTWEASQQIDRPLITMSMGAVGALSRVAGKQFGSAATFGMVGKASAPGQIPLEQLNPLVADLERWVEG